MAILTQRMVRPIQNGDWIEMGWRIGVMVAVELVSAPLLLPDLIPVWIGLVMGMLAWLVWWHAHAFAYTCLKCGAVFSISVWRDISTIHGIDRKGTWYYLKCHKCRRWGKCRLMRQKK